MGAGLGQEYGIYLSATTQTGGSRFDTTNFTQLLLVTSISWTETKEAIDISTFDDVLDRAHLAGRKTVSVTINALLDFTGDVGQEIAETAFDALTQAASLLAGLLTTDVVGDKEWYWEGVITNNSKELPDQGPATLTIEAVVNTASLARDDVS